MSETNPLPRDHFSLTRRQALDNPAAIVASTTIHAADWYGNLETWTLETVRIEGRELVFLQRNNADGGLRLVLPPEVTAAQARHRDQLVTRARRRAGHKAVATKRMEGTPIGNPDALRAAARRKKRS